jgi:tRNA nucleotidyltransferase/poly(A) polymerase
MRDVNKNQINQNVNDSQFKSNWEKAKANSLELSNAVELMVELNKLQPEAEVLIVGGVARDILLGNEIDDVDLATNMNVEKIKEVFNLNDISKNDNQKVYTIKWNDFTYELALFRIDSLDEGRNNNNPTITDSFVKDSERRDITINAFGIDYEGNILDHQGGVNDLNNGIIRAVGVPNKRFREDPTRILRVFRFAAKNGFQIEQNTYESAINLKDLLNEISKESIAKEFFKSAKSGKTLASFVESLMTAGILVDILPEFTLLEGFTHNPKYHPEGDSKVIGHILEALRASVFNDSVINLAILFHDLGKGVTRGEKNGHSTYYGHEGAGVPIVRDIINRMKFNDLSQADKRNILFAVGRHMLIHNILELSFKKLRTIVLDEGWEVLKAVGYADEASRGPELFDVNEFNNKIEVSESKVRNTIGSTHREVSQKVKPYVNGNLLLEWVPELSQSPKLIGKILPVLQENIINVLASGGEPDINVVKNQAIELFNASHV